MQRLIDANELERKAKFNQQVGNFIKLSDLKNAQTIDAEPVVRCKNCKYHYMHEGRIMCNIFCNLFAVAENHYCSYGAKMDKEAEQE